MKTILFIAACFCLSFVLTSCGTQKMTFQNSAIVPGATGEVKVKKDRNENYAITLDVANLAESKKLTPPKELYMVWMEDGKSPVKKLGRIDPSSGTFSKALKASLSAIATTEPTKIFISAEDNAEVTYPVGEIVLTTKN